MDESEKKVDWGQGRGNRDSWVKKREGQRRRPKTVDSVEPRVFLKLIRKNRSRWKKKKNYRYKRGKSAGVAALKRRG